MQLKLTGHTLKYETEQIVLLFFPNHENVMVESILTEDGEGIQTVKTKMTVEGMRAEHAEVAEKVCKAKREIGNLVKRSAFFAAKKLSDLPTPWGILTGIRPAKPVLDMMEAGISNEEIRNILKTEFLMSQEKIDLVLLVAERGLCHNDFQKRKASIYIGIPFCPTRCHYCSFISSAINKTKNILDRYVEQLICEIIYTSGIIKRQNIDIDSIYIGGGTPTTLSKPLLEKLLSAVAENFNPPKEYTIEAGRPDTITKDKLETIKSYGVDRISVNPQSIHNETLKLIGRNHTFEDWEKAFYLAREVGFKNINSDIIAGLPGENTQMFCDTVDKIISLNPEAITVHTLYIKRTAWLKGTSFAHASPFDIAKMLRFSYDRLGENAYVPYYMYKQKATLGNLENIGYAKRGYECLYNIKTMSDRQSIIALGAGAASKVVLEGRIERIFNCKNADDYINGFETVLEKKRKLESFYEE